MRHVAKVRVPRCWGQLIDMCFADDLKGISSEKHCQGTADPDPHYDDARSIAGRFPNGAEFALDLCSGQSNYYGGLTINHDGRVLESDVLEDFDALELEDGADVYALEIEWVADEDFDKLHAGAEGR